MRLKPDTPTCFAASALQIGQRLLVPGFAKYCPNTIGLPTYDLLSRPRIPTRAANIASETKTLWEKQWLPLSGAQAPAPRL
eukprot:12366739-Alexandrium_andersonii.AAC.1